MRVGWVEEVVDEAWASPSSLANMALPRRVRLYARETAGGLIVGFFGGGYVVFGGAKVVLASQVGSSIAWDRGRAVLWFE